MLPVTSSTISQMEVAILTNGCINNWLQCTSPTEFAQRAQCVSVGAAKHTRKQFTFWLQWHFGIATHLDHNCLAAVSAAARALFLSNALSSSRCPINFAFTLQNADGMCCGMILSMTTPKSYSSFA